MALKGHIPELSCEEPVDRKNKDKLTEETKTGFGEDRELQGVLCGQGRTWELGGGGVGEEKLVWWTDGAHGEGSAAAATERKLDFILGQSGVEILAEATLQGQANQS